MLTNNPACCFLGLLFIPDDGASRFVGDMYELCQIIRRHIRGGNPLKYLRLNGPSLNRRTVKIFASIFSFVASENIRNAWRPRIVRLYLSFCSRHAVPPHPLFLLYSISLCVPSAVVVIPTWVRSPVCVFVYVPRARLVPYAQCSATLCPVVTLNFHPAIFIFISPVNSQRWAFILYLPLALLPFRKHGGKYMYHLL